MICVLWFYEFVWIASILSIALRCQDLDSMTDHSTHLIPDTWWCNPGMFGIPIKPLMWYVVVQWRIFSLFHISYCYIRTWENLPWNSHEESKIMLHGFSFWWFFSESLTQMKLARGNFLPHDTQTWKPLFPCGWRIWMTPTCSFAPWLDKR